MFLPFFAQVDKVGVPARGEVGVEVGGEGGEGRGEVGKVGVRPGNGAVYFTVG